MGTQDDLHTARHDLKQCNLELSLDVMIQGFKVSFRHIRRNITILNHVVEMHLLLSFSCAVLTLGWGIVVCQAHRESVENMGLYIYS